MQERNFFSYSVVKICGEKLWYVTQEECFLMNIDIKTGLADSRGVIPGTEGISLAYRGIAVQKSYIYLIPFNTCSLMMYDVCKNVYIDVELPIEILKKVGDKPSFFEGEFVGDKLIMYGFTHFVLVYDTKSGCFDLFDFENDVKKYTAVENWYLRFGLVFGSRVFLNLQYTNVYIVYDLGKNRIEVKLVGGKYTDNRYSMALKCGDSIYHVSESDKNGIVINAVNKNTFEVMDKFEWRNDQSPWGELPRFLWGTILDNKLLLFPGHQKQFVHIDLDSYDVYIEDVEDPQTNWNWFNCWTTFYGAVGKDDIAVSIMPGKKSLLIARKDSLEYRGVCISDNAKRTIRNHYLENDNHRGPVIENADMFTLNEFVQYVI